MKIFLAGTASHEQIVVQHCPLYVLESYYYFKPWQIELIKKSEMFLLDSGAFTFLQNAKAHVDWDRYIENYAEFINQNNVKYFFELDIDAIVGYSKVVDFREKLERLTQKKCIPVWHRNRGYQEYLRLCELYDYIAIVGIAIKEIKPVEYPIFTRLIKDAHERNCEVHGLGFTKQNELKRYRFDSVDSTTWLNGDRFGELHFFNGKKIERITAAGRNQRLKASKTKDATMHNYNEWLKFQRYAKEGL